MPRLFAIDSMAILYRSYFAMIRTPLNNSKGLNTSGLFGFLTQLIQIIESEQPDYLAVVADAPDPTFRHQRFPEYKATREKMPDDLVAQLPYLPRLIEALHLPYLILPGFEADDIIGTLMKNCREQKIEGVMVTSDKDYMQLINEHILMLNHKHELLGERQVYEKFGCTPAQVIEVLGLMGDSSDNVPGVRGIGEKTAIKLIQEYGSIHALYERLDSIKSESLREKLNAGHQSALLSRELVTIHCEVPLSVKLEDLSFHVERLRENTSFHEILAELEFKSLLRRFQGPPAPPKASAIIAPVPEADEGITAEALPPPELLPFPKTECLRLDPSASLHELLHELQNANWVSWAWWSAGGSLMDDHWRGLAFSFEAQRAYYLEHPTEASAQVTFRSFLQAIWEDRRITKVGHHLKFLLQLLAQEGISPQGPFFDTAIAAHWGLPLEKDHTPDHLLARLLQRQRTSEAPADSPQLSLLEAPTGGIAQSLAEQADMLGHIQAVLKNQLEQTEMLRAFEYIEMPLVGVLASVERAGVALDQEHLGAIVEDFTARLEQLTQEIHAAAGESFNINSVVELQRILYEKLTLHTLYGIRPKKIKLGNGLSTDEETLEKMNEHPLPRNLLIYRELNKLKNTYLDQLPTFVHPRTKRIHSSFRQTVAATGRLASDNPNLQNIPIRTEEGRKIRRLFIPSRPDHVLISADYSQIELRLVAHYSKDPTFLEAYRQGLDIHTLTAAAIFNVQEAEVTREMRSKAKEINFGLIYRMGPERLALVTQTSKAEAKEFIEKYFQKYATIHQLQERFLEQARKEGFAVTLLGRRRYLPDLHGKGLAKSLAEGAAINTPIQGSAAEIMKLAMIAIEQRLQREKLQAQMILTVHDELVFDAPHTEADVLSRWVKQEMEQVMFLEVPLVAEVGIGKNWLEAH